MAKGKEEGLLQVPGKLLHPIPFYDGANNLEAVISIDFKEDENATVIGILNHEKLNQDIKNGLKIEELIFLFARLCKLIKSI